MKKVLTVLLSFLMVASMSACGSKPVEEAPAEGKYPAGTYVGKATGKNGEVLVEVTLSADKIDNVVVKEHKETTGLTDSAIKNIPAAIVENQSLNIDVEAGATITSNAILDGVKAALTEAGVNVEELMAGEKVEAAKGGEAVLEDSAYDVVVVGAGGAGLSAAIMAKEAGASVILVEKAAYAGGNTLISYAEIAAPNNWIQQEEGIEDSNELLAKEMWEGGGKLADKELVDIVANNATDAAYWMRDTIGVEYKDHMIHEGGHSVKRSLEPVKLGGGMIPPFIEYAEKAGVEIVCNAAAEELITDETGRVTGVKVNNSGKEVTLTANKGVVLASGGFGANVEMREKYNTRWENVGADIPTTNAPSITGDGIVMAEKIGANLVGMEHIQLYPFTNPKTGSFYNIEEPSWSDQPFVYVNQDGKRFVNEMGMRDERASGILAQKDAYALYNKQAADALDLENKYAEEYALTIEQGLCFKGETLQDVADHLGVELDVLTASIEGFNAAVRGEAADEFNRTTSMHELDVTVGPWYLIKGVPSVHHTMGGVQIDKGAHVINTEGTVIPGLYAAGEVCGGIHGNNRVGTCAIADIVVFGRIAGTNAATGE